MSQWKFISFALEKFFQLFPFNCQSSYLTDCAKISFQYSLPMAKLIDSLLLVTIHLELKMMIPLMQEQRNEKFQSMKFNVSFSSVFSLILIISLFSRSFLTNAYCQDQQEKINVRAKQAVIDKM